MDSRPKRTCRPPKEVIQEPIRRGKAPELPRTDPSTALKPAKALPPKPPQEASLKENRKKNQNSTIIINRNFYN
jgi:hypothetical protein